MFLLKLLNFEKKKCFVESTVSSKNHTVTIENIIFLFVFLKQMSERTN